MLKIGYLLLILGFLAAAYVAALDPETVAWAVFVPTIVVAAIGVAMIRYARRAEARGGERLQQNRRTLADALERLERELAALHAGSDTDAVAHLHDDIDRRLREDLRRFADARESMIHLYSLNTYADIMSAFAAGERYINRVWSASADGYPDEARSYLKRASSQIALARNALATADRQSMA